jgi:adenylate cyclase
LGREGAVEQVGQGTPTNDEARRGLRHELRTPVHHILGCSELLLEEAKDEGLQEWVPALEEIHAAGQRALALVNDRLDPGNAAALLSLDSLRGALGPSLDTVIVQSAGLEARAADLGREDLLPDLAPIRLAAQRLLKLVDDYAALADGAAAEPTPPPPAEREPAQPVPTVHAAGPRAAPAALLVVDDIALNRDMLSRRLERDGHTVLRAENGRQALELLATTPVDLVLLDMLMPEMDGYEVLRRRQADPRLTSIPFIVISALDEMDSVVRCIELGAEDYLPKPFDPVLLRARVGACLEKKRLRDQEQAHLATIERQAAELAEWNHTLEARVQQQVSELERLTRLRRFLSPQVAEAIVSAGNEQFLESHRGEVTVVFTDLRGFTAFSGTAEPEEVMAVLREYHQAMGALIFRYEGTLERFAGDGLMVFFNDPICYADHTSRAVRMAVEMRAAVAELAKVWRARGHQLGFGVGIAQGYATLGKIGFEGRFDYAAIGTVTNLASRLSDEARAGEILVNDRAYLAVEAEVEAKPIDPLPLKGFPTPVPAYSIFGLRR